MSHGISGNNYYNIYIYEIGQTFIFTLFMLVFMISES